MSPLDARAFIQARMSSRRCPGKMLAPFRGRPLIKRVVERVAQGLPAGRVTVLTSTHPTDDPLALYAESLGVSVFRGPLDDVLRRFQLGLEAFPCDWVFRISGDSPLYDPALMQHALGLAAQTGGDLVTNLRPRTFPPGRSVELLRAEALLAADSAQCTPEEREHVTKRYYNHPARWHIVHFRAHPPAHHIHLTVDTLDDLRRLETFDENSIAYEIV